LDRQWIGIDISPFAIQLIRKVRIDGAFPHLKLGTNYQIDGLPTALDGAKQFGRARQEGIRDLGGSDVGWNSE
jgi:hypothetical protein